MSFINTIPVQDSTGEVREMYEKNQASMGYVPNYVKIFSHRPQVMGAWGNLLGTIRANLDLRRYELITLAAARGLRSSYCMLAHGNVLLRNDFKPDDLEAIAKDYTSAELAPVEIALMAFAEKIARDAAAVTADDIQQLRDHGLTDAEIFDAASAAAARCFFSKLLDAMGAQPDSIFLNFNEELRKSLTIGREVSTEQVERLE